MSKARNNIINRLRTTKPEPCHFSERDHLSRFNWDKEERINRFVERMVAVRAEIIHASKDDWAEKIAEICQEKRLKNMLVSPETAQGKVLYNMVDQLPDLQSYDHEIEDWKSEMFNQTDAGFTTTLGGIAETGSLILWPTKHEPRLMSLVPPVHIALLDTNQLYTTFSEVVKEQGWVDKGMPTNALLVSGPSKSADIEQTLAYGVHGPKELVVVLIS
ncbi:LutC/YkgG family protein [Leucothrix pacifica]|uniref:Lactate utilization protein n=1 Tax=Leucothrix pacifica TaxID=1247513 RepID=A0A317CJV7_9GAMM|nr:lactate utilization protein [Leucothrix pacifica]PWQ98875.1 lactate utilization protein [Leucothrix pacifica]